MDASGQGRNPLAFLLRAWQRRQRPEAVIDRAYPAWAAAYHPVPPMPRITPTISVVMPVHEAPADSLRAAIASVEAQSYGRWELCIVDDASTAPHVMDILGEAAARDHRIDPVHAAQRLGIAGATNAAIARATGTYVAFMDHDDVLAPHALAAVAAEIEAHPDAAMIFSDEDRLVDGRPASPYFKPGWNPDLMLGQNLVCHLAVFSRSLLSDLEGVSAFHDGAQDYDLALRAMDAVPARRIRHIPQVLYGWRRSQNSFSAVQAAVCQDSARKALTYHLRGRAVVGVDEALPQWSRVRFRLPDPLPTVSVFVPEGAAVPDHAYPDVEIRHGPPRDTGADILVSLGGGLVAEGDAWLHELVSQAQRSDIGCAGGKLLAPHFRLAHTGYVLDPRKIVQSVLPASDADDPGYRGHFRLMRNVAAVSGDCLAVRGTVFRQAGGWNGDAGAFADVDLCLRLAARDLRSVWTPHASLRYLKAPRRKEVGAAWMRARWGATLANDPYLNPNLELHRHSLRLRAPRQPTA